MSPEPVVRWQAAIVAVIGTAAAVFGAWALTLTAGVVCGLWATGLYTKYRWDLHRTSDAVVPRVGDRRRIEVPAHRLRPDLIVAADGRLLVMTLILVAGMLGGLRPEGVEGGVLADALRAALPPAVIVAAVIYCSSLVDWYIILPRISGLLGPRPCRDAEEPATFPSSWRATTRWWYLHRAVAAFVTPFGASAVITQGVGAVLDLGPATRVVAFCVLGFLAAYRRALPWAVWEAMHPQAVVGQTVERYETERRPWKHLRVFGRRLAVPSLRRTRVGPGLRREYVYDVGVEGLNLVDAARYEAPERRASFETSPTGLDLKEAHRCAPAAESYTGCAERCSRINWYCVENPDAFRPKRRQALPDAPG